MQNLPVVGRRTQPYLVPGSCLYYSSGMARENTGCAVCSWEGFYGNVIALKPRGCTGPAELGAAGSRHVLARWQSRCGWLHPVWALCPGCLQQVGHRLEAEVALPSLPAYMSGPSLWGIQGLGACWG